MDEAPQTGGTDAIAVNGWSVLDAIYRRDKIWIAMTVEPSSGANANQATAAWVALNASNPATPTFAEFGTIGGNDLASNASTFMPNLAVGPFGALGMGFAWSASTKHPSAGFAVRPAGGSFGGSKLLLAGTDYYLRAFGGPSNRWGDYSGAAVDPIDGCFWFYNEASETAGDLLSGEDGRWQTLIGKYCGNIVFLDDFERGDTCRWSSAGCF